MQTSNLKNRTFKFDATTVATTAVETVADAVVIIDALIAVIANALPVIITPNGADLPDSVVDYYEEVA